MHLKQYDQVQIIDKDHPHYKKIGKWTGGVQNFIWGSKDNKTQMLEIEFDNSDGKGCFVKPYEIKKL